MGVHTIQLKIWGANVIFLQRDTNANSPISPHMGYSLGREDLCLIRNSLDTTSFSSQ
jgi:hypothetical protein